MKYLKLYESKKPTKEDIESCFIDLSDDGLSIKVDNSVLDELSIIITKYNFNDYDIPIHQKTFNINNISETLRFAMPYMEHEYNLLLESISTYIPVWDKNIFMGWHKFRDINDFYKFDGSFEIVKIRLLKINYK